MTDTPPIRSPKFQFVTRLRRVQRRDLIWVGVERNSRWAIIPQKFSNLRAHVDEHCLVHDKALICRLRETIGYDDRPVLVGRDGSGADWLAHQKPPPSDLWSLLRRDGAGASGVAGAAGSLALPDSFIAGPTSDTGLERLVAASFVLLGVRFTVSSNLKGRPDFILPERSMAVFAHGCHHHAHGCGLGRGYGHQLTQAEVADVRGHDARVVSALNEQGWQVLTIWECAVSAGPTPQRFLEQLQQALSSTARATEISAVPR